jgi:cell division protein FtsX
MPVAKMHPLVPEKVGLSLGLLFALVHFVGILLIQWDGSGFVNWLKALHFISADVPFTVLPFELGTAIVGIIAAFVTGAIIGALFAWIWNWSLKIK